MFYKKLWKNKKVLDVQDVGCTKNSTHSFIIETLVQIFYNGPTQCVICNGVLLPAPPSCFLHPDQNVLIFWIGHSRSQKMEGIPECNFTFGIDHSGSQKGDAGSNSRKLLYYYLSVMSMMLM